MFSNLFNVPNPAEVIKKASSGSINLQYDHNCPKSLNVKFVFFASIKNSFTVFPLFAIPKTSIWTSKPTQVHSLYHT